MNILMQIFVWAYVFILGGGKCIKVELLGKSFPLKFLCYICFICLAIWSILAPNKYLLICSTTI